MATVGEVLRNERLRQGLQVSAITASLKIRPDLLDAMEAGRFDLLPGGAYRRRFLRQYARVLGLDEEAIIVSFYQQYEDPPVALPAPPPSRPSEKLRLAGALLALVASFIVYRKSVNVWATHDLEIPKTAPHLAAAAENAYQATLPQPAPARGEAARSDPLRPVRVSFRATEPVWVSVQCDGAETFTGTMEDAETKTFEASRKVTVLVGNAGGLAIQLNERPLSQLGAHGEIQTVEFTADGVRRLPRKPAAPPGGNAIPQGWGARRNVSGARPAVSSARVPSASTARDSGRSS